MQNTVSEIFNRLKIISGSLDEEIKNKKGNFLTQKDKNYIKKLTAYLLPELEKMGSFNFNINLT